MSFEQRDADALKRAQARGLTYTTIDTAAFGWTEYVFKLEFGPAIVQTFTAQELTATLEALVRFSGSETTTLWIDITTHIVHQTVIDAIEGCAYFEPNLYVTHFATASHRPAPPLPGALQRAVEKVASRRRFWHPGLNSEAPAHPSQIA